MKKALLFLLIGFTTGFFIHALFFPDLFANGIFILPEAPLTAQTAPQTNKAAPVQNETLITYDGEKFSRTNVKIESSRYISIVNKSPDTTMDLSSSEPGLSTPRPYAFDEMVKTRIDKPGQYVVTDRRNPSIRMVITVK